MDGGKEDTSRDERASLAEDGSFPLQSFDSREAASAAIALTQIQRISHPKTPQVVLCTMSRSINVLKEF